MCDFCFRQMVPVSMTNLFKKNLFFFHSEKNPMALVNLVFHWAKFFAPSDNFTVGTISEQNDKKFFHSISPFLSLFVCLSRCASVNLPAFFILSLLRSFSSPLFHYLRFFQFLFLTLSHCHPHSISSFSRLLSLSLSPYSSLSLSNTLNLLSPYLSFSLDISLLSLPHSHFSVHGFVNCTSHRISLSLSHSLPPSLSPF